MASAGSSKRRKKSNWLEPRQMELVYRRFLPAGRQSSGYPAPVVRSLRWHPNPGQFGPEGYKLVVACATDRAFLLYTNTSDKEFVGSNWIVKSHRRAGKDMEASCLEWSLHLVLATGTRCKMNTRGFIRLLQYKDERLRTKKLILMDGGVGSLIFIGDGSTIAASIFSTSVEIGTVSWTQSGEIVRAKVKYPEDINYDSEVTLKVHPRRHDYFVTSCSTSDMIWVWRKNRSKLEPVESVKTVSVICDLTFDTKGSNMIVSGGNNHLTVWKAPFTTSSWLTHALDVEPESGDGPSYLTWINDRYLAVVEGDNILVYETKLRAKKVTYLTWVSTVARGSTGYHQGRTTAISFHSGGQILASGNKHGHIFLWNWHDQHYAYVPVKLERCFPYEDNYFKPEGWSFSNLMDDGTLDKLDTTPIEMLSDCSEGSTESLEEYLSHPPAAAAVTDAPEDQQGAATKEDMPSGNEGNQQGSAKEGNDASVVASRSQPGTSATETQEGDPLPGQELPAINAEGKSLLELLRQQNVTEVSIAKLENIIRWSSRNVQ